MPRPDEKYELVALPRAEGSPQRFRVKALRDIRPAGFDVVPAGTVGGYVDGAHNLAQEGECWIAGEAMACDYATVTGNASMRDRATLMGNAHLMRHAQMSGESCAMDGSSVSDTAHLSGKTLVTGSGRVGGGSLLHDVRVSSGLMEDVRAGDLDSGLHAFDLDALAADQQQSKSTAPCGASTASGTPCTHMVRPNTQYCPSGHRPKRAA